MELIFQGHKKKNNASQITPKSTYETVYLIL